MGGTTSDGSQMESLKGGGRVASIPAKTAVQWIKKTKLGKKYTRGGGIDQSTRNGWVVPPHLEDVFPSGQARPQEVRGRASMSNETGGKKNSKHHIFEREENQKEEDRAFWFGEKKEGKKRVLEWPSYTSWEAGLPSDFRGGGLNTTKATVRLKGERTQFIRVSDRPFRAVRAVSLLKSYPGPKPPFPGEA